jgi:hypothetical protein
MVSFRSKASPLRSVRRSPHQLISGRGQPVPQSLMRVARARGSKAGWDLSPLRHLSAQSSTGHTSTLDLISLLLLSVFGLRSSPFEDGTLRHHASFEIAPKRHEQLAQCYDGDTADAAFRGTDAQITIGLMRKLYGSAPPTIEGGRLGRSMTVVDPCGGRGARQRRNDRRLVRTVAIRTGDRSPQFRYPDECGSDSPVHCRPQYVELPAT